MFFKNQLFYTNKYNEEVSMEGKNKTHDLWFYSFLRLKGFDAIDYIRIDKGKAEFIFEINDDEWKKLKLEFSKSDISKVKWYIESAKDIVMS